MWIQAPPYYKYQPKAVSINRAAFLQERVPTEFEVLYKRWLIRQLELDASSRDDQFMMGYATNTRQRGKPNRRSLPKIG
jgi:hypothetical protein